MALENILETGLLNQDDILNLELKQFKNTKWYAKLQNMKGKIKNQLNNPIVGEEGIHYSTCLICSLKVQGSLKSHVKSWHPVFDWESFRKENIYINLIIQ